MSSFKQLTGSKVFRSWKEYQPGDSVVGRIELIENDSLNKSYQNMTLKVEEFSFADKAFRLSKGERLHINPCASLQNGIEKGAVVGKLVKIVYMGQAPVKKGTWAGKLAHHVEVYVADESQEDVSNIDDVL